MSKLDKLSILGVRSFDNTRSETIQFHAPLTLIVGYNGSGKTTIIECLKYVTTGELPPNAKLGGAWIHDPKLCGEKEVLAQVKASFRSTEGTKMVCTRNIQLTVKKTSRSMKTLEGNILMIRDGERVTMSSRVAEMDSMMPQYFGVSRAILDSVIFCHQEESLWPLSEPSKLKTRFDEIFEALKYTKAIENIKVLQKTHRGNLKDLQKDEDIAKQNKDRGQKIRMLSEKLDAEITALKAQGEDYGVKIKEAAAKAEQAWYQADRANKIVGDLSGKRIEEKTKEESVQSLRLNLKELDDTDEELQSMLEQYEERVQSYEDDRDDLKAQYVDIGHNIATARNKVSVKERECGSYEAQQESYERQVQNRERLIKETARSHSIRGFDTEISDDQVQAFMDRINKMARDQNAAFERAKRETQEELQKAQKVLNDINARKSAFGQRKENAWQTIAMNDRKIDTLQIELDRIDVDEGAGVVIESNLRDTEIRLGTAKADGTAAAWESNIEAVDAELRRLDERAERLNTELVEGTRQAGDSARLDFVQKELKDRQRSLDTMVGAHGDNISSVLESLWTPSTVEVEYQRTVERSASHVSEAERQRDGASRELEQLDFKLSTCRSSLKAKREALKHAENVIRKEVNLAPAEYVDEVRNLEESHENLKADAESFSKVLSYFESCIRYAGEHNGCRTCARSFANTREREKMLQVVQREKQKFVINESDKKELAELEEDLKKAKAVSADFELWERLQQKEIPLLDQEEKDLETKRHTLVAQLEEKDVVVSERQAAKKEVDALARTVQNIVKYTTDVANFQMQIQDLVAKQKSAGLSRGLEIVQGEIKKVNEEAKSVKARLTRLQGDRDRSRALLNSLELEVRDIKSKLDAAKYQLKEKLSFEGQIKEYKRLNIEQRETVKSVDQELQALVPQLSQAQASYDDVEGRGAARERELQAETNKLNGNLSQLRLAAQEINAYVEKGGKQQLARGKAEIGDLQKEVRRLETERDEVTRKVKTLEDQLRNHEDTKRSISDNQRYRRDLRQLNTVREEIHELEKHNAEDDKAYYEREGQKWQMERNKIAAEQATVVGTLKSKDDQLQQYCNDWESEYKDAARVYKELHIKVETTKACVEDLGRYAAALDKAIMKYHSMKMEHINRIIEELWAKTYQGTDVDKILIRSESETTVSRKSYNYRVCMVKQDAEMDMRGRCSAGQKVLASIIIRLALAECFGVNCGIIALDEPTTNLDRENIRALAASLNEIIKFRRAQKNFQLIVITHDEDFLREMGCSDFADVYYRVSRNERQKSIIERQSIAEVI